MVFSGLRRGLLPVRVCYYGKYACHFGRSCRVSDAFRGDCGEKVRIIPADCRGSSWLCHGSGLVHSVRRLLSECRRNDGRKNGKRSHPGVGLQLRDGIRYRRGRHGAAGRKSYRLRAYLDLDKTLEPGDTVSGQFRFRATTPKESRTYHAGNGIFLLAYQADEVSVSPHTDASWRDIPARLRHRIQAILQARIRRMPLPLPGRFCWAIPQA